MVSRIPLVLGLRTRMEDPYVYSIYIYIYYTILYYDMPYSIVPCQNVMWFLGLLLLLAVKHEVH